MYLFFSVSPVLMQHSSVIQLTTYYHLSLSVTGLQFLYFLSQTFAAPYITCFLASISPMGSAAPVLLDEQTSDEDARIVIRKDSRR